MRSAEKLNPHSVPVLYVPGAGGSKAQARSIASEAYRQLNRRSTGAHGVENAAFAVYTVHFNKELSAYDARLLSAQAKFVARTMAWLHQQHGPPFIIVVGHSMGEPALVPALVRTD